MGRTPGGGCMFALIILILIFFFLSGRFSQPHGPSSPSTDPGADAQIVGQKDMVPVGTTAENYDKYTQLMASKNKDGWGSMILNGQIMLVPSGTKCHVINAGTPDDEIRIEEGNFYGHDGFVAAEFVKR